MPDVVLLYGQDVDGCPGDADLKSLLQMVILCIEFPEKHFAKVLQKHLSRCYSSRQQRRFIFFPF